MKRPPWRRMGDWRCSSTILDLGTRWRWVVSFTPATLPLGKEPPYPLDGRLGGPQSWYGRCGVQKISFPPGNQSLTVQAVARRFHQESLLSFSEHTYCKRRRVFSSLLLYRQLEQSTINHCPCLISFSLVSSGSLIHPDHQPHTADTCYVAAVSFVVCYITHPSAW
jgi:hypothetical protein